MVHGSCSTEVCKVLLGEDLCLKGDRCTHSTKHLTEMLRDTGSKISAQMDLFKSHIYQSRKLAIDLDQYMQAFLKPFDGSVRDLKSFRELLDEINFDGIIVIDTGFSSRGLADIMPTEIGFMTPSIIRMANFQIIFDQDFFLW